MLGTIIFAPEHVCKISFRLLNNFKKLCRKERIALDREEEEKKQKKKSEQFFWRAMFGVEYLENL